MYEDTVTLFNRYHTKQGDLWYPTILHGVDLIISKAAIVAKYGMESQDKVLLHVKFVDDGGILVGKKLWLPPKEWSRQEGETLSKSVTFTSGKNFDFFFAGEWRGSEPINDMDTAYAPDGFYDYMNQRYDNVFAITSAEKWSLIPHFEITGK